MRINKKTNILDGGHIILLNNKFDRAKVKKTQGAQLLIKYFNKVSVKNMNTISNIKMLK